MLHNVLTIAVKGSAFLHMGFEAQSVRSEARKAEERALEHQRMILFEDSLPGSIFQRCFESGHLAP
jgi:hypothetical protein